MAEDKSDLSFRRWRWLYGRLSDETGATFLEYALLAALIGIGVGAAVAAFGEQLAHLWHNLTNQVRTVNNDFN